MLDHAKLNKMTAMMVGASQAEADNAYRAIVKMVRSSNVAPSNVHLHVYGDEDDYVGSTLKAKDDEIDQHLSDLEAAYDEIGKLRAENGKVAALQVEIERLRAENARLKADNVLLQEANDLLDEPNRDTGTFGWRDHEELEAYRREDGESLAAVKSELRKVIPIHFGFKSVVWRLLNANGLKRAKGTVCSWLSGRSKMPAAVLNIIRAEAKRLATAGVERFGLEWKVMQKGYLYGYSY